MMARWRGPPFFSFIACHETFQIKQKQKQQRIKNKMDGDSLSGGPPPTQTGASSSSGGGKFLEWMKSWTWQSTALAGASVAIVALILVIIMLLMRDKKDKQATAKPHALAAAAATAATGTTNIAPPVQAQAPPPKPQPQLFPPPPGSGVDELDEATALEYINNSSAHVKTLMMAYAPWCGGCKSTAPQFYAASQQAKALGVHFVAVNAHDARQFTTTQGVKAFPTFFGIKADGTVINMRGGRSTSQFVELCGKLVDNTATSA
jgi:thiol-disulfide isomerase/thioredoxin